MTSIAKKPNRIQIYACGGAGIDIAALYDHHRDAMPGVADMRAVRIDTSDSNISPDQPNTYIIDTGRRGSGKIRITNAQPILDAIPVILNEFPPEDFSVVLHSTGGGSGSVAGPFLARELKARGKNVILILIGTLGSVRELENSDACLSTYFNFIQEDNVTFPTFYLANGENLDRQAVDMAITSYLSWISIIFSGMNHHLDVEDLSNFLNIERATDGEYAPDMTMLDIFTSDSEGVGGVQGLARGEAAVTVATLARQGQDTNPGVMVPYHAEGFVRDSQEIPEEFRKKLAVHMVSVIGAFTPVVEGIRSKLAEIQRSKPVVQQRPQVTPRKATGLGGGVF